MKAVNPEEAVEVEEEAMEVEGDKENAGEMVNIGEGEDGEDKVEPVLE